MTDHREQLQKARAAKKKALELYGELDLVNGIGLSHQGGEYQIKINLVEELPQQLSQQLNIKKEIDGVKIITKVVGKIKKQTH